MVQFQEYNIAWAIYVIASLGLIALAWQLFRCIAWRYVRGVLLLTALALFLTPAIGDSQYWAPAWIIASLQLLFEGVEGAEPAARILLFVWLFCFIVYTLFKIILFFMRSGKQSSKGVPKGSKPAKAVVKKPKGNRNRRIPPRIS